MGHLHSFELCIILPEKEEDFHNHDDWLDFNSLSQIDMKLVCNFIIYNVYAEINLKFDLVLYSMLIKMP